MASLKSSLNLSLSHIISSSSTPKSHFHTKPILSLKIPILPPKLILSKHSIPIPVLAAQQDVVSVAVEEEDEEEVITLKQTQKDDNKRKLFVLNLPWSFTAADVKEFFGECGTVADVEIIKREDGKKGFAFVTMSSGDEAQAAIKKFDSHELLGRIINIEYAKTFKKPTPRSPGPHSSETCHKLFVSNLAWKVRASNLKQFFVDFNPVSTRVVFSPSGSSAGYGFVSFGTKQEAESAVSTLNGKELLGRPIILKISETPSETSGPNEDIKTASEEHGEL